MFVNTMANTMALNQELGSPMRVLVTGGHGQLGRRLVAVGRQRQDVDVVGLGRADMDVLNPSSILAALEKHQPSVVIHAAAYTAVDRAEEDYEAAHALNAVAVGNVASACRDRAIRLIHISTDYVFGQAPRRPLRPEDPIHPEGVYAQTKADGERLALSSGADAAVVRVSWLYDGVGHNFMGTMLRLAKEHGALRVVDDQVGVPTAAPVLASGLLDMAVMGEDMPTGIWHYAHEGVTSWHGFASEIMKVAGLDVPVEPVPTSSYPTPARRPVWSVLDGEPLRARMGWPAMHWKEGLEICWRLRSTAAE
jgi:dTDP-4-dehydrorhamnose reductase